MKIKTVTDGVVYQLEHIDSEIGQITIDVIYSSGEFGELEFEHSMIDLDSNFRLTPDQINQINKDLECGLEEEVVRNLIQFYQYSDLQFSPNEYSHLITQ